MTLGGLFYVNERRPCLKSLKCGSTTAVRKQWRVWLRVRAILKVSLKHFFSVRIEGNTCKCLQDAGLRDYTYGAYFFSCLWNEAVTAHASSAARHQMAQLR